MKKNHALFVTNRLIPNSLAAIITIVQLLLHFDCEWWVYCLSVAHHTHIRAHTHTALFSPWVVWSGPVPGRNPSGGWQNIGSCRFWKGLETSAPPGEQHTHTKKHIAVKSNHRSSRRAWLLDAIKCGVTVKRGLDCKLLMSRWDKRHIMKQGGAAAEKMFVINNRSKRRRQTCKKYNAAGYHKLKKPIDCYWWRIITSRGMRCGR